MKRYVKLKVTAIVIMLCVLFVGLMIPINATSMGHDQMVLDNNNDLISDNQAELMSENATGVYINYSEIEIAVGETKKLTASTNPVGQSVMWQSGDSSIASVDDGVVTAKKTGTVVILAGFMDADRNMRVAECTVNVRIPEGQYHLRNMQTGYYADIKGPTMASGTTIHQWKYNGNNSQKWIFTHLGDGYYSIKSANSSTAYYLGVINDSTGLNVDIVLRTGTLTNGMKWRIEATKNGAFKIIPKTGESKGYILGTSTSDATNGAKLIQGEYIDNNSYRDEWLIHPTSQVIIKPSQIYYDSTCDYTASELIEYYNAASIAFLREYNVYFDLTNAQYSSQLNLATSCNVATLNGICSNQCSPLSSCNDSHHRGANRLIKLLKSSSYYTYRFVGYQLCMYDCNGHSDNSTHDENKEHNSVVGAGYVNNKDSITSSLASTYIIGSIQHELTHNLGASHNCTRGQECVLKNNFEIGVWCDACKEAIRNKL